MKTILSKINLTAVALFLLVMPSLSNCKKDDDKIDQSVEAKSLVGNWNASSFKIDGVETKGLIIAASEMEFEADGDFKWVIVYTDNSSDIAIGKYELNETGTNVTFTDPENDVLQFEVALDNGNLQLSGSMDEGATVIKAERK